MDMRFGSFSEGREIKNQSLMQSALQNVNKAGKYLYKKGLFDIYIYSIFDGPYLAVAQEDYHPQLYHNKHIAILMICLILKINFFQFELE